LVGHSLGGFIVQKYLETHSAVAAVLLASAPPSGLLKFNLRLLRRHPGLWLLMNVLMSAYPAVSKPEYAREWLFSPGIPDEQLARHYARLQDESYRALLDTLFLNLPNPSKVKTPVQVLGAENDAIFSVEEVRATARAYGVEAIIFPAMAHNMIVEPGWRDVADTIMRWTESVSGV
jgi:pimeloyl-ACP methyl ester carboxylesterase